MSVSVLPFPPSWTRRKLKWSQAKCETHLKRQPSAAKLVTQTKQAKVEKFQNNCKESETRDATTAQKKGKGFGLR